MQIELLKSDCVIPCLIIFSTDCIFYILKILNLKHFPIKTSFCFVIQFAMYFCLFASMSFETVPSPQEQHQTLKSILHSG